MLKNTVLFFCTILSFALSSCDQLLGQKGLTGIWKVHYKYDGETEAVMSVKFDADHNFTFHVDEQTGGGVWTIDKNKVELEFSDRMVWKGILNENKEEISKGIMINSGYGNGGGRWDGKKIE